jgi:hypothetical protein
VVRALHHNRLRTTGPCQSCYVSFILTGRRSVWQRLTSCTNSTTSKHRLSFSWPLRVYSGGFTSGGMNWRLCFRQQPMPGCFGELTHLFGKFALGSQRGDSHLPPVASSLIAWLYRSPLLGYPAASSLRMLRCSFSPLPALENVGNGRKSLGGDKFWLPSLREGLARAFHASLRKAFHTTVQLACFRPAPLW